MRLEVPECKRCCLCIPLRYGIIIFGYLHLAFNLFILTVESMRWKRRGLSILTSQTISMYKGVAIRTEIWLTVLLYVLDVIFDLLLLIGLHMKKVTFISAFYYFGITTTLATFLSLLLVSFLPDYPEFDIFELCLAFSAFVLQIYLLLLIRSEVTKRRYQEDSFSCYNQSSEVIAHPPAWTDRI